MKLVIAGVDEAGRSYVEATREFPQARSTYVWNGPFEGLAEVIDRLAPEGRITSIEPEPGGVKFVFSAVPPAAEDDRAEGRHHTHTTDLDTVIAGRIQCILDAETVELEAGDFILLKAAPHAWRNVSDAPTTMLFTLHRAGEG
jgi:mannose-6-phosphate isomerase-like protein (cupin superfamily)